MSDIASVLTVAKLSKYAAALDAAGYDDLDFLRSRTEAQLREISKMVKMPVGHADRFIFAISKTKIKGAAIPALPPASSTTSAAAATASKTPSAAPTSKKEPSVESAVPEAPTAPVETATKPRGVAECVAICVDRSGSMSSRFQEMKARGENGLLIFFHCDAAAALIYSHACIFAFSFLKLNS